jgi:hypothetical protein
MGKLGPTVEKSLKLQGVFKLLSLLMKTRCVCDRSGSWGQKEIGTGVSYLTCHQHLKWLVTPSIKIFLA